MGILPPGALGVAFFYHLTRGLDAAALGARPRGVVFLERPGSSGSAADLRGAGRLRVQPPGSAPGEPTREIDLADGGFDELAAAADACRLPEVLLVCPNPDQLLGVITACVRLLEIAHARRPLTTIGSAADAADPAFPLVVLCANGIYFQRLRQIFVEKLEESSLFGRLPDLWPDLLPRIVNRLLRGVTIQTGRREGSGAGTRYFPGPPGPTRLAGGDARSRARAAEILSGLGGWFETAPDGVTVTRLEFDKALINLTSNLLGQLHGVDERTGAFRTLTVGELYSPPHAAEIRALVTHVVAVGRAVGAYRVDEPVEPFVENLFAVARDHAAHVPSSLQHVELELARGTLRAEVPPTERWTLDPLVRYARSAGLEESEHYLVDLTAALVTRLEKAIRARPSSGAGRPASSQAS